MSRAFTKETDGSETVEELPERPIAPERNLVTPQGLRFMDEELSRLHAAYSAAQGADNKTLLAQAMRDLKYWTARRASAELVPPPADDEQARFGHCVTLQTPKGDKTYCIVGLDEADATAGLLSYISPLARMLLGKSVGDSVALPQGEAEITAIFQRR